MLLILGMHIGLQYKLIANRLKLNKIVSILLISITLIFGIYRLTTTRYLEFLTSAINTSSFENEYGNDKGLGRGKNHIKEESFQIE